MKKAFFLATLISFSLTLFSNEIKPMAGDYVVGITGNYKTVKEAVSDLNKNGVSGEVTFYIETGTYPEKIEIGNVSGASSQNTINFISKTGNYSDVIISSTFGEDHAVVLNDAKWVTFTDLTIKNHNISTGNALYVMGTSSYIFFKNISFEGVKEGAQSYESSVIYFTADGNKNNFIFEDCEVNDGFFGILKSAGENLTAESGLSIVGCTFYNQKYSSIFLKNQKGTIVSNNVISTSVSIPSFKAVAFENVSGAFILSNNVINSTNGNCGLLVANSSGTTQNFGTISNNSINLSNKGEVEGIAITGNSDNIILNFNRIKLNVSEMASNQSFYRNNGTGRNVNMMNNIFFDLTTGGYTILGNTYKDMYNQLPTQSNPSLTVSANGIMMEKVDPLQ